MKHSISVENIVRRIYLIRDQRVMLDCDLAEIYGTTTKRLNQHVKRNLRRFPTDFMFQLSETETADLKSHFTTTFNKDPMRSQNVTGSKRNVRYQPFVFTEHGAVMLACVLKSNIAVEASVQVVRAYNQLKEYFLEHKDLSMKLDQVKQRIAVHDHQIQTVFNAITQLQKQPKRHQPKLKPKRQIGFLE